MLVCWSSWPVSGERTLIKELITVTALERPQPPSRSGAGSSLGLSEQCLSVGGYVCAQELCVCAPGCVSMGLHACIVWGCVQPRAGMCICMGEVKHIGTWYITVAGVKCYCVNFFMLYNITTLSGLKQHKCIISPCL